MVRQAQVSFCVGAGTMPHCCKGCPWPHSRVGGIGAPSKQSRVLLGGSQGEGYRASTENTDHVDPEVAPACRKTARGRQDSPRLTDLLVTAAKPDSFPSSPTSILSSMVLDLSYFLPIYPTLLSSPYLFSALCEGRKGHDEGGPRQLGREGVTWV